MNEPIISPWLFYFLDILEPLKIVLFLSCCLSFGLCFIYSLMQKDAYRTLNIERGRPYKDWIEEAEEELKRINKRLLITKVVMVFSSVLLLFVPSKETACKMYIASQVTPSKIQMAGDVVDKSVDKVIEKIINYQKKLEEKK